MSRLTHMYSARIRSAPIAGLLLRRNRRYTTIAHITTARTAKTALVRIARTCSHSPASRRDVHNTITTAGTAATKAVRDPERISDREMTIAAAPHFHAEPCRANPTATSSVIAKYEP